MPAETLCSLQFCSSQIPQFVDPELSSGSSQSKMGYGHFLYRNTTGHTVPLIIRDLFDNSIISYKTSTVQNNNLVMNTIREAKRKEKVTGELQLHSD